MKKLFIILCLLFISFPIYANDNKVIDEYDCLSETEIEELNDQIKTIIDEVGFDVVVYIAYQEIENVTALADDYFDYNGYGLGSDRDGIILCINYYYRDYTITTRGHNTISLFNDARLDYIYSDVTSYLSNGDTLGAINTFLYHVEDIGTSPKETYIPDVPYDNVSVDTNEHLKQSMLVGLGGATLISIIVFFVLRGQLKTQKIKTEANYYMSDSNVNIFRSGEIFLYKTSHTHKVERNDDHHHGGGGSSIHVSSSGASHGGGGSHHF